ncbi:MAG: transglutaminase domain-containing protein [Dehalococcoidia bacterium]|nr:MAG: transglutaminase domain-containing protein [Dehalococcoidia bacterium]
MAWQLVEQMLKYLKPTSLCDNDSEEIKKKAHELTKHVRTPKGAALRIFHFVRDEIPFSLDFTDVKASQTLRTRSGLSFQKTNLQIALLRAAGIPARYRRVSCKKQLLRGIILSLLYMVLPEVNPHSWCECYLSGKWVSCEAMLDKALFEGMTQKGLTAVSQISTIEWDGASDLIVVKPWIVEDFGASTSLDDLYVEMAKRQLGPKILQRALFTLSNRHTNNLRKH